MRNSDVCVYVRGTYIAAAYVFVFFFSLDWFMIALSIVSYWLRQERRFEGCCEMRGRAEFRLLKSMEFVLLANASYL